MVLEECVPVVEVTDAHHSRLLWALSASLAVALRHFTVGHTVLMFGGGMKAGVAYGKTAVDRPMRVVEKSIPVVDLHATILRAAGIPPDLAYEVDHRRVYVTKDAKGKPVLDLFA